MPLHKDLTGADLHEPKGAGSAASGQVYVFNGSGSGTAKKIGLDSIDLTSVENPNIFYLSSILADVSTPSSILVSVPVGSTFESCMITLGGAVTGTDSIVSFNRNGVDSFGSSVTIPVLGSGEGVSFSFTATANKNVTSGDYVKITADGASTGTAPLYLTLKFIRAF